MLIIGVDESGTGALAGPWTMGCVALEAEAADVLRSHGVTDSKSLTDRRRHELVDIICEHAAYVSVEIVGLKEITQHHGSKRAWVNAANAVLEAAPHGTVIVDGNHVQGVVAHGPVKFRVKADTSVIAVGAASILAKCVRNSIMADLGERYPEYGWSQNFGYGSPTHLEALTKFGRSTHHRDTFAPAKDLPLRRTRVVNIRREEAQAYIGRAGNGEDGIFGNPVKAGQPCPFCKVIHLNGGDTLPCYRRYLRRRLKRDPLFATRFYALRGKTLGCTCAPARCHGDVMVEFLDA